MDVNGLQYSWHLLRDNCTDFGHACPFEFSVGGIDEKHSFFTNRSKIMRELLQTLQPVYICCNLITTIITQKLHCKMCSCKQAFRVLSREDQKILTKKQTNKQTKKQQQKKKNRTKQNKQKHTHTHKKKQTKQKQKKQTNKQKLIKNKKKKY